MQKKIFNIRRFCSNIEHKSPGYSEKPDPHLIKHDYIGPPDKESNLRPYVRCIHKNETRLARLLRLKQISVEEWNQSFWSRHNKRFYEEKEDFIKMHNLAGIGEISADKMSEFYKSFLDKNKKEKEDFIKMHNLAGIGEISADKMSECYKSFLDKNKKVHILYNLSWYLKNAEILMLSFQVALQKLFVNK